ncbi:MAG: helix-turn-helix transcriptional regulator [Bacteroidota bacterium]
MKTFDELKQNLYGAAGTPSRDSYEAKAKAYVVGRQLREARENRQMTQQALADKINRQKTFISRIENGKVDVQLSTLFRIAEEGLGMRLKINFELS